MVGITFQKSILGEVMQMSYQVTLCTLAAVSGAIAITTDLRYRRIPNWLTGSLAVISFGIHAAWGGWHEVACAFYGMLFCSAIFLCFYLVGGMGAGDIKLLAAEGCLLGINNSVLFVVLTASFGALLALGVACATGRLRATLANVWKLADHHRRTGLTVHPELNILNSKTLRLPYALAIALGVVSTSFLQPITRLLQ